MAQRVASTIGELTQAYVERIAERTPSSQALHAEACRVLSGGVSSHLKGWHPFYVREAKGSKLVDLDGNEYVDLIMGFGPNFLGHSPDVVIDAVREAIGHGTSLAVATPHEVRLAQKISQLVPSMEQMRFVVTGTEATMMAIRAARAFTGRWKIARFEGHYHGQHETVLISSAAIAGSDREPEGAADCAGIPPSTFGDVVVLPWDDADAVAPLVRRHAGELAAVICEPIPFSSLGGAPPDLEFMRALRELTREQGTLLVFDEVVTGFRLGLGGAAEHFGFAPDLHTFGKLAGGGFPIGVFGGRRDVMEKTVTLRAGDVHQPDVIFQSGTFSGAPASMVAGLTMLEELEKGYAHPIADRRGAELRDGLVAIGRELELPLQVTGMSSWFGVFFTDRPIRNRRDTVTNDQQAARAFALGLLAGGVYVTPSHPGFVSAAHTEADIQHVLAVCEQVLAEIKAAR